jgi:hypothetical protein
VPILLGEKETELLERFIITLERIAEAYETSVCHQSKLIDQTSAMMEASAVSVDPIHF